MNKILLNIQTSYRIIIKLQLKKFIAKMTIINFGSLNMACVGCNMRIVMLPFKNKMLRNPDLEC